MTKYLVREMPNLDKSDKKRTYAKVDLIRNIGFEEFMDSCVEMSGSTSKAAMAGVMHQVANCLARYIALGYSVTLDGVGTFSAKIGPKKNVEEEQLEKSNRKPSCLCVTGINFRPSKVLLNETNKKCNLERGGSRGINRTPFTREERLQKAQEYLAEHTFMRTSDYMALVSMPRSTATKELNEFCRDITSGITYEGRRSSKVYVKRE